MSKITESEIEEIIGAYFDMISGNCKADAHRVVVEIVRNYPNLANFYLTEKERKA